MADRRYAHFMIIGLRQPGDGDGANHAGAFEQDQETAAVRGKFAFGQQESLFDALTLALQNLAQVKRTVPAAVDQPDLVLDSFIVVVTGTWAAGMEKLLFAAADIDGDGQFILDGLFHQPTADLRGGLFVEGAESQLLFF